MKTTIICITLAAISFTACNSKTNQSEENNNSSAASVPADNTEAAPTGATSTKAPAVTSEMVAGYLELKNALANDNGKDAAEAGNRLVNIMKKFDKSSLTPEQKKVYEDIEEDAREHAEHIGVNADKIAHQREHFDILSQDLYDLVKVAGSGQTLYLDHCPMYNDNKGANWLSETKEIKNPYYGKSMLTCGEVKEVLN